MKPPDKVPEAVIDAIAKWYGMHRDEGRRAEGFQQALRELRWSLDHYSFDAMGMYVGVELDGYLHT